jgi:hypothetical protein
VPVEYDATATGTVPDDIPGMRIVKYAWENSPWTRVSFGTEWVLDPTGEHILSTGFHKHANLPMVQTLEDEWEKALTRFARIRSHKRGSQAEAEELAKVRAEIEADLPINRPCWTNLNIGTIETLRVVATDEPSNFKSRLSGVFTYPDPHVRKMAAEHLGVFMDKGGRAEFSPDHILYLQSTVVGLLSDEDADVRHAAALAMYEFEDLTAPDLQGEELVAAAAALWTPADEAVTSAKKATASLDKAAVGSR